MFLNLYHKFTRVMTIYTFRRNQNHWMHDCPAGCVYFRCLEKDLKRDMSHSQMLGKFEYGGGLIFKVVLEC